MTDIAGLFRQFMLFVSSNKTGTVIGIIGLIVGIYGIFISRKKMQISYIMSSYVLIKNSYNSIYDLKILYQDKFIPNLTVTKIALWNSGNLPIKQDDIAPQSPLAICITEDSKLLNATIVSSSDKTNNFKLHFSDKIASITFDYINKTQGIVIEVLHTGMPEELMPQGIIIGGEKLHNIMNNRNQKYWFYRILKTLLISLVFTFFILFTPYGQDGKNHVLGLIIIATIGFCGGVREGYQKFRGLIPKELRTYNEFDTRMRHGKEKN